MSHVDTIFKGSVLQLTLLKHTLVNCLLKASEAVQIHKIKLTVYWVDGQHTSIDLQRNILLEGVIVLLIN